MESVSPTFSTRSLVAILRTWLYTLPSQLMYRILSHIYEGICDSKTLPWTDGYALDRSIQGKLIVVMNGFINEGTAETATGLS